MGGKYLNGHFQDVSFYDFLGFFQFPRLIYTILQSFFITNSIHKQISLRSACLKSVDFSVNRLKQSMFLTTFYMKHVKFFKNQDLASTAKVVEVGADQTGGGGPYVLR